MQSSMNMNEHVGLSEKFDDTQTAVHNFIQQQQRTMAALGLKVCYHGSITPHTYHTKL